MTPIGDLGDLSRKIISTCINISDISGGTTMSESCFILFHSIFIIN